MDTGGIGSDELSLLGSFTAYLAEKMNIDANKAPRAWADGMA
jgi:hypothetical protein